ncbi:MAG: hypothetical protein J2P51_08415 [Hyphomicrobiaceae bacterium]|nr:hypothetical protein [Hyphomicrobiaceae bacterium]
MRFACEGVLCITPDRSAGLAAPSLIAKAEPAVAFGALNLTLEPVDV